MILLDTTFLVAVVDQGDSLHDVATKWAVKLAHGPKLTTEYVLVECVNMLCAVKERPLAAALIELVEQIPGLKIEWASRALFEDGIQLFRQRPDKEWSLTDCISFVVMQRHGVTQALTYDHHFEQAGFDALLRRMPA
jgi:predicted nucleic acid-binding protein